MKITELSAIAILITVIFLAGCVQVTINVPQVPGNMTSPATHSVTTLVAEDTPEMDSTPQAILKSSASADGASPGYIVPVGDTSRVGHRTFTFYYAPDGVAKEYTFRVPVNMSVYYGARQTKISLPSSSQDPAAVKKYIASFESDPAMEELYDDVLIQLRNARYQDGEYLSDDQYLELIVAFVQQIPYVENPSSDRKYPVEVIYDKSGDSDEKSLLLTKLLSREGYDVALLVYEDLGYEATGIRVHEEVPDASLKVFSDGKRDYVFVDAGVKRFIGSVPDTFVSADDPGIYPVGNGTKSYGPINYVWKVVADLRHMSSLGKIDKNTVINPWDKYGTCKWIKNSKLLQNTTCYCCDM
ncbi:MAG: hypothetical protein LUQ71_02815 [Methanoregula sp.]|nr:hypothetical protein [Methanoregula sp.]